MPALDAAAVVGTMPNIPANRLNAQFDCTAFGFTLSSEELSGLAALKTAARALAAGEIDAALVGAVDLSVEPVHMAAAEALLQEQFRKQQEYMRRKAEARNRRESSLTVIKTILSGLS